MALQYALANPNVPTITVWGRGGWAICLSLEYPCLPVVFETMALRRPPTRIELKDSDIAEYDEVREWGFCECCFAAAIYSRTRDRLRLLMTTLSRLSHRL
jgi:hypothetical protein